MPHFVGIDVSKATCSICILDEDGEIAREGVVETTPKAIAQFLRGDHRRYRRIGLEATSLGAWLCEGLARAGLPTICIDARHAHSLLKTRRNKTDKNDARGIAELMRLRAYRASHVKTPASREARLLLSARRTLLLKKRDIDNLIRASLLQAGLKAPRAKLKGFTEAAASLAPRGTQLANMVRSLLEVRRVLDAQALEFEAMLEGAAAADPVCQRLMTAPGVGTICALTFRAAIDVPERFARSRDVGAHLGLTPRSDDSGERVRNGHISKWGDAAARAALFMAALSVMRTRTRSNSLKAWGERVVAARGTKRGTVAVARRLAVILHRMWIDETPFDFAEANQLA
jgi:transposase